MDEHMVVDGDWRRYLREQMESRSTFTIPVALHSAAFHLPGEIGRRNFLRVDRVTDPTAWGAEERQGVRRRRLLGLLTQVISRLLSDAGDRPGPGQPGEGNWQDRPASPITVFISHAKADGVPIAEALRYAILGQGQLHAFFDERAKMVPAAPGRHTLNCLPDLRMTMHMVRHAPDMTELLIPPPGLADRDRQEIESLAGSKVRIRTFNEIEA